MDITEFLAARYDEEERLARAASSGRWKVLQRARIEMRTDQSPSDRPGSKYQWIIGSEDGGGVYRLEDAVHIARYQPDRVLADIAAKRHRLWLYERAFVEAERAFKSPPSEAIVYARRGRKTALARDRLIAYGRFLAHHAAVCTDALSYADHPDFQVGWEIDARSDR